MLGNPLFRQNGVPVNQYDLAETLFTFATVPMMVTIPRQAFSHPDADAYDVMVEDEAHVAVKQMIQRQVGGQTVQCAGRAKLSD